MYNCKPIRVARRPHINKRHGASRSAASALLPPHSLLKLTSTICRFVISRYPHQDYYLGPGTPIDTCSGRTLPWGPTTDADNPGDYIHDKVSLVSLPATHVRLALPPVFVWVLAEEAVEADGEAAGDCESLPLDPFVPQPPTAPAVFV